MHHLDYSDNLIQFQFSNWTTYNETDERLSHVMRKKISNHEKFFGIEISANSKINLNYNKFKIQPLFTSIIWIGQLFSTQQITEIPALKTAEILDTNTIVLPHFTCYNMTKNKLNDYLNLMNYSNILALRGDEVVENQEFRYASEMVKEIRNIKKDTISIGVGGYPEIHPEAISKEEDMKNLKAKIDAGADFIITQICFSPQKIIEFIKDCRDLGIKTPILPGIYVPNSYRSLKKISEITKIVVPTDLMEEYKKLRKNGAEFKKFAIGNTIEMISSIFNSDLNLYGIQFFTLNDFDNIQEIVDKVF